MTGDNRRRVPIADTTAVPSGDDPVDEVMAELRAAREVLAAQEATEEAWDLPTRQPSNIDARLAQMSTRQLEAHIDRLEADLQTLRSGWRAGESE